MSKMRVEELKNGQTALEGVFIAKGNGNVVLIRGHGKRFEEYAEKFRELERQGKVRIQEISR